MIDLREQLQVMSKPPPLPSGWQLEVAMRAASQAGFGGDFLVPTLTGNGTRLESALVDVSGKGLEAGTRALMLAGAISGLLGAVDPTEVLGGVNQHVLRQDWIDGFATAMHTAVDLRTGEFLLTCAGHLPAAQFHHGTGRWELLHPDGPLLGVLPDAKYPPALGQLRPGDALLTVTDGMIERPGEDLMIGMDRLLGEATRLVLSGFAGGARHLLRVLRTATDDDRAVVLLWRSYP